MENALYICSAKTKFASGEKSGDERVSIIKSINKNPEISYKNLVWTKKNELRLKYVRERTFFGDIVIILKTIFIILKVK